VDERKEPAARATDDRFVALSNHAGGKIKKQRERSKADATRKGLGTLILGKLHLLAPSVSCDDDADEIAMCGDQA